MFLQTLRRILPASNNYKQLTVRLCSSVSEPKLAPAYTAHGIHSIRVTGKVMNIHHRENDQIVFYMNSNCAGNFRKVHKIVVTKRNPALLSLARTKLATDQNVSIEGKLSTVRFQTEDRKHRSNSAVIATELCIVSGFAVANGPDTATGQTQPIDENCVELFGTITTDISGTDFKAFTLASIKNSNLNRMISSNKSFNRIFVYDKELFPLLNDVQKGYDQFLVRGEISYRMAKNESGRATSTSYITAKQLYRIQ